MYFTRLLLPQDYIHIYKLSGVVFEMINKSYNDAFANYSQSMQDRICVRAEQAVKISFSSEYHNHLCFSKQFLKLYKLPTSIFHFVIH